MCFFGKMVLQFEIAPSLDNTLIVRSSGDTLSDSVLGGVHTSTAQQAHVGPKSPRTLLSTYYPSWPDKGKF